MSSFHRAFHKLHDGSWLCIRDAQWQSPFGHIQVTQGARFTPGTALLGVDFVRLLDDEAARNPAALRSA